MTALDLVTSLINQLDDVITELRLHNLGNLLWVSQVECHIGKCRIQHTTSDIIHLTTHSG